MAEDIFEDLDILDPPKKVVKMAGELIDISFLPSKVTLSVMKISADFDKKKITTAEMFEKMIEIIAQLSTKSNAKITEDWLYENVSVEKITNFLHLLVSSGENVANGTEAGGAEPAKN